MSVEIGEKENSVAIIGTASGWMLWVTILFIKK